MHNEQPKIIYISFDTVPAAKGAAIHIGAFTQILADYFGLIQLITVSPNRKSHTREIYPNVIHTTLPALGDNLINRVLYFQRMLKHWWGNKYYSVIHFRSIFEGFPLAVNKNQISQYLIFEVNGLPSIELKYRYPAVDRDYELMHKLRRQEQICLDAADLIITPSNITKNYLESRGVTGSKIRVIPNGVDLNIFSYKPKNKLNNSLQLVYFGTLSAWQGVEELIEAIALSNTEFPTILKIVTSARQQQIIALEKLAEKLNIEEKITILNSLSQQELVNHLHLADVIIAPLTINDRNILQGCCPLKVLEGMASGVPVIASDLPVVQELGNNNEHFLLVKPNSAKAIKDGLTLLKNQPDLGRSLALAARHRVENNYTWERAGIALIEAYKSLLTVNC